MPVTRVLLVCGSLRAGSTNTALLRTAHAIAPPDISTRLSDDLAHLPHFNPDDDTDEPPLAVVRLRAAIHEADALLFCVPEYAGALPGAFKNLLDWTIGDARPGSIYDKRVAWINASVRDATDAHASLRKVLGYAHACIVEEAIAHIPIPPAAVADDGLIHDERIRQEIRSSLTRLARV